MNRPKSAYTARAASAQRPLRPIIDLSRKPNVTCFLAKKHNRAQSEDFHLAACDLPVVFRPKEDSGTGKEGDRFKIAFKLRSEGRFEAAVSEFEAAIQENCNSMAARLNLGVCLMKLGRFTEAARTYKDSGAYVLDPRLAYNLSLCLIMTFSYDEARAVLGQISKSALASDVGHLLKYVDSKSVNIPATDVTEVSDLSGIEEDLPSFSRIRPKTGGGKESPVPDEPSWGMWKIFKSIEQYGGGEDRVLKPVLAKKKARAKSARAKVEHIQPKSSFITGQRQRPSEESTPLTVDRPSGPDRRRTEEVLSPPLRRVHMLGAITQEDMEDGSALKSVHPSHRREHAVMVKISEARAVIEAEEAKLKVAKALLPEVDVSEVVKDRLTVSALEFIRAEMKKSPVKRDYAALVLLVAPLRFFAKFQREVRVDILRACTHTLVPANTYVFKQHETEAGMHIILAGSVEISKKAEEYGSDSLALRTFYDGETFGEVNLLATEEQKRPVSVRTLELTDLFTLERADYHRLMMSQMHTDIEAKLRFFAGLALFSGVQRLALVPLVSNVDVTAYRFGQTIIAAGTVPKSMFLIYTGLCQVYAEGCSLRQRTEGRFAKASRRYKPQFRTGNTQYSAVLKPSVSPNVEEINPQSLCSRFQSSNLAKLLKDHYIVKEMTRLDTLQPGDFFCSRSLTGAEGESVEPAKYTIVAESAEVQVYELTKVQMEFLGENVEVRSRQRLFKAAARRTGDVDCPPLITRAEIDGDFEKWSRYKRDLVENVRRARFMERNKDQIISALRDI